MVANCLQCRRHSHYNFAGYCPRCQESLPVAQEFFDLEPLTEPRARLNSLTLCHLIKQGHSPVEAARIKGIPRRTLFFRLRKLIKSGALTLEQVVPYLTVERVLEAYARCPLPRNAAALNLELPPDVVDLVLHAKRLPYISERRALREEREVVRRIVRRAFQEVTVPHTAYSLTRLLQGVWKPGHHTGEWPYFGVLHGYDRDSLLEIATQVLREGTMAA